MVYRCGGYCPHGQAGGKWIEKYVRIGFPQNISISAETLHQFPGRETRDFIAEPERGGVRPQNYVLNRFKFSAFW